MSDLVDRQMVLSAIMDTFAKSLAREKAIECVVKVPGVDPTQTNAPNTLNALDCISRQAVLDAIDEIESEVVDGDGFQYEKWRQFFCDLPPVDIDLSGYSDRLWRNAYEQGKADAERKTGKWVYNSPVTMKCDQCGYVIGDWDVSEYVFCPHCGSFNQ